MFNACGKARYDRLGGVRASSSRGILDRCAFAFALLGLPCGTAIAGTPLHDAIGAPEELTIKGTIRSRVEGIDGQFRPNAAPGQPLQHHFRRPAP